MAFFNIQHTHKTKLPTKFVQAVSLHAAKYYHKSTYTVVGYTACKMQIQGRGKIFRAVASFGDKGQQWYDWCLVNSLSAMDGRDHPL